MPARERRGSMGAVRLVGERRNRDRGMGSNALARIVAQLAGR
jgi:hypothetical protein